MPTGNQIITYLDLFAGAGGLSEGFSAAGYQPIAHVEMDVDACNTLKTRESFYYLNTIGANSKYLDYLKAKISRDTFYELIPRGILNSVICETICDLAERSEITTKNINSDIFNPFISFLSSGCSSTRLHPIHEFRSKNSEHGGYRL